MNRMHENDDTPNLAWSQVPEPRTAPYTRPDYMVFEPIPDDIVPEPRQPMPVQMPRPTEIAGPKLKYPRFHVFRFLFLLFALTVVCFTLSVTMGSTVVHNDPVLGRNVMTYQAATWPLVLWALSFAGVIVWFVARYIKAQREYREAVGERHRW